MENSKFIYPEYQLDKPVLRKGFTLIELLIVIMILAILAGVAMPYLQDYIEDARISKARSDMSEIRNALIRYELNLGVMYTETNLSALVGPYLFNNVTDPWGSAYMVEPEPSTVLCLGPDRTAGTADDIRVDFRPPLAPTRATWYGRGCAPIEDDVIRVRFTRPVSSLSVFDMYNFRVGNSPTTLGSPAGKLGGIDPASAILEPSDTREVVITLGSDPTIKVGDYIGAVSIEDRSNPGIESKPIPVILKAGK